MPETSNNIVMSLIESSSWKRKREREKIFQNSPKHDPSSSSESEENPLIIFFYSNDERDPLPGSHFVRSQLFFYIFQTLQHPPTPSNSSPTFFFETYEIKINKTTRERRRWLHAHSTRHFAFVMAKHFSSSNFLLPLTHSFTRLIYMLRWNFQLLNTKHTQVRERGRGRLYCVQSENESYFPIFSLLLRSLKWSSISIACLVRTNECPSLVCQTERKNPSTAARGPVSVQ